MDGVQIPFANTAKYLGMTVDAKLRWNENVEIKIMELQLKWKKLNWLLGRIFKLSIENKLLIYNQIFKPIWTYGAQFWGCPSEKNVNIIQHFQNKEPWYIIDYPSLKAS